MPKWISGEKLMEDWQIVGLELFDYVKQGLHPYNKVGEKLSPPDVSEKMIFLKKLEVKLTSLEKRFDVSDKRPLVRLRQEKQKEKDMVEIEMLRNNISNIKSELSIIDIYSWANFHLSTEEGDGLAVINLLTASLYKIEDILKFGTTHNNKGVKVISKKVIELIKNDQVRSEVKRLYDVLKKEVGFASNVIDPDNKYHEAALNEYRKNKNQFEYIKEDHLQDRKIYALNTAQTKRDFIGRLLKKIVSENNLGNYGAQRLYAAYIAKN
jgi:hypothetical protein